MGRLEGRTPRWYRSFQPLSEKGPPRPVPGRPLKRWTGPEAREGGAGWQEVTQAAGMSHLFLPSPV